jgi:NHL repeat
MHEKKKAKVLFSPVISLSLIFALTLSALFLISSDFTELYLSRYDSALAFKPTPPSNQTISNASTALTTNHPPKANAGINQTVNENTTVVLNGIASDPEDDTLTYLWKQIAGPSVKLSNNTNTNPSFTAPTVPTDTILNFSLTAKDDKDATSVPAAVSITVKAATQPATAPPATTGLANESNRETGGAATEYVLVRKWGSNGTGDGQFSIPAGIAVDSADNVYVNDSNNSRIQKFDSNGSYLTKWGLYGAGNGQFDGPDGIAIDSSGKVYVADGYNNRIQVFAPTNVANTNLMYLCGS